MIEYKCRKCTFEGRFEKEKVRCPQCRKMSLIEKELISPEPKKEEAVTKNGDKEPIFKGNNFVDDLTEFKADMAFTKQVGFTVTPREKREPKLVKKNCSRCGKEFNSYLGKSYICGDCSGVR